MSYKNGFFGGCGGGGSFILFQLSTQVFSKHLSKATKEPLNCGVQFEPISQVQHGAIFCFSSLSALRSTRLLNGSADLGPRVCISICLLVHQCVLVSSEERAGGGTKTPHSRAGERRLFGASSLWHKSFLWSLEHNKARHPPSLSYTLGPDSKIIPIMQHVCDCRNPLWPLRSSSWRTVPETRCQAASGGTSSMPNPRHTRRPCSPPSREARPALCFFSCLYPFIWHGCQPVVRRSQRPPGRRIQALLLPSSRHWSPLEKRETQVSTKLLRQSPLSSLSSPRRAKK